MDNFQIADAFTLLSKLLDIHGENSFKSKSYASAAFAIEKLPIQLENISPEKLASLKGIGTSTAQKITEMLETGKIKALEEIIFITPKGILEMMQIKGLGPKKINAIWKEMGIETIGELWYACKENRLKLFKGFGEKTQADVMAKIEFFQKSKGSFQKCKTGLHQSCQHRRSLPLLIRLMHCIAGCFVYNMRCENQ
jgi:DNA polymerase (family 10)